MKPIITGGCNETYYCNLTNSRPSIPPSTHLILLLQSPQDLDGIRQPASTRTALIALSSSRSMAAFRRWTRRLTVK